MAWQEIDIANAKINMSKVVPYDETLSILDKKQGYYHNNRLTALNKWVTDSAVGYKCYKRKANPNNLVDGELTDYIEVNKITENGSLVHMIDVADSYYKLEKEAHDDNSNLPEFVQGVVLDDTLIGKVEEWANYEFYKLYDHMYLVSPLSDSHYKIMKTHQTKKIQYKNNYDIWDVDIEKSKTLLCEKNNRYFIINSDFLEQTKDIITKFNNRTYKFQHNSSSTMARDWSSKAYNIGTDGVSESQSIAKITVFDENFFVTINSGVESYSDLYLSMSKTKFDLDILGTTTYNIWVSTVIAGKTFSTTAGTGPAGERYLTTNTVTPFTYTVTDIFHHQAQIHNLTWGFEQEKYESRTPDPILVDWDINQVNNISLSKEYSFIANYVNDSTFTNNGFVVNYTNKLPVTLGHKYKIIARLDTQGASYLGSDNKYSYISQNGEMYKISIDKMYPNVAYDEEVNIIENADYCQQVNGYKIFNTTTYYNAIYNDDKNKVICSCDDWNGRYKSNSATLSNATLKSTSRVGNFWNATLSWTNIPNKAISDELNDILEIENPTYSWTNPDYTIHEGTEAYIYTQNNNQVDTMYQQWVVDKDGFRRNYSEDNQFTHNKPLQLVPSILFSHYLKSDVENIISIGSESYRLKTYSYSTTTPALVYQSIAESININPNSEEMVIQGSYYEISGSNDRRLITNPYDTSTTTYCCDVTGLKYIGYDSVQAYFYSSSTATIYTFNGANKLNAYLEVDNRIPMTSADKDGITVCNIPSINLVAMAFTDGVLLIINQQAVFIPVQNIQSLSANREYGIVRIGSSYYYFGTNSNIKSLIASTGGKSIIKVETLPPASSVEDKDNVVYMVTTTEKYYVVEKVFEPTISYKWTETTLDSLIGSSVTDKLIFKTSKIGFDRKTNATMSKQRLCVYSDNLEKGVVKVTITSRLGNKINTETYTKTIQPKEFIDNEFQWEFNQKFTKANWFTIECELDNLDLLNHYVEMSESTEENLVR